MGFFKKLTNFATGADFINKASDTLGVSDSSILRTGGNPIISAQNNSTNAADQAEAAASAIQGAKTDAAAASGRINADGTYTPLFMDGSDHEASNAAAALSRAKYDDWKARFFPKVDELMGMTTYMNKDLVGQETASAAGWTNRAFNNVEAGQVRNNARFGMTQTAEQRTAQESALSLGRATATAGAENNTRLMLKDRDRAIATGGLGGTPT